MPRSSVECPIDLTSLAASLSHQDGDGHRWNEEEARQWLDRMKIEHSGEVAEGEADRLPSSVATGDAVIDSG